jgi:hypothetical protein
MESLQHRVYTRGGIADVIRRPARGLQDPSSGPDRQPPSRLDLHSFASTLALAITLTIALLLVGVTQAEAITCNKYVSTSGKDSNSGNTEATAYRHVRYLLENGGKRLRPGQAGCLVSGQTFHEEGESTEDRSKLSPKPEGDSVIFGYSEEKKYSENLKKG